MSCHDKGEIMASIYKNNGTWYISLGYNGKRKSKSLKTNDYGTALKLKPFAESSLISELTGLNYTKKETSFKELSERFLKQKGRAKNTQLIYENVIKCYNSGKQLPTNPNSRSIHIRTINACWNWGLKKGLISKAYKLDQDTKGEPRQRTFTKNELSLMFSSLEPKSFNKFVQFAYYTGGRSGEIRSIADDSLLDDSLVVRGKSGRRFIKLNSQAKSIIDKQDSLWDYKKDYVSHKFKKEVRRLGIKNARFHDLRRTFGLNLIKQGMSIYKVSKLLGHSSVRTTEKHYAPLHTTDIEDFTL
jgi:integrase